MTPTQGTLLGGRVAYAQWPDGYRTGIEPVLLAASIPAQPGERVVEAGCGAGAGLLCLAARVPGIVGVGLEIDPALAGLAAANFATNGPSHIVAESCDVVDWSPGQSFHHAFANPPWHDPTATPSPNHKRRLAKQALPDLLGIWVRALACPLLRRGTLSLILPAASFANGIAALHDADCGEITLLPIRPHTGEAARLVILRGIRSGRGPDRVLPGLVLHQANAGYTAEAEAVLRYGQALAL